MARQDAITGARNLVIDLPVEVQRQTFLLAKEYALGRRDASYLDGEVTGSPHPLSSFKFSGGSASLRGKGLRLAEASATDPEDHVWVRAQAISLLSEQDTEILHDAAVTLSQLPRDVTSRIGLGVLAAHGYIGVRNFVHLREQRERGAIPDRDTVGMRWGRSSRSLDAVCTSSQASSRRRRRDVAPQLVRGWSGRTQIHGERVRKVADRSRIVAAPCGCLEE